MPTKFKSEQKILGLQELLFQIGAHRIKGQSIGFTNGCFDLLHKGHVAYLEEAKSYCSFLIVAINSDASVKQLNKGQNRPINNELDRAFVLAGLSCVGAITVFNESTPLELIQKIQPDFLFKGGDYDASITDSTHSKYIVGSDVVKKSGGKVITIPFVEGYSTTSILEKSK